MRFLTRFLIRANARRINALRAHCLPTQKFGLVFSHRLYAGKETVAMDEFEVDVDIPEGTELPFAEGVGGIANEEDVSPVPKGIELDAERTRENGEEEEIDDDEDADVDVDVDAADLPEVEGGSETEAAVKNTSSPKKNLLKDKYHDLFLELFTAKNQGVELDELEIDSGHIVNWKCADCAKQHRKSVIERVFLDNECPHCVKARFTSLEKEHPNIAKEWAPLKNPMYRHPRHLDVQSIEKIRWICAQCTFEFESSAKQRCSGAACPRCFPKHGNWVKVYPDIAKEWHPLRNGDLRQSDVNETEDRLIWWMCTKCSYEFEEGLRRRVRSDMGCPLCRQDFRQNVSANDV